MLPQSPESRLRRHIGRSAAVVLMWMAIAAPARLPARDAAPGASVVAGEVRSAFDGSCLPGVVVSIPDLKLGTQTNSEGRFSLTVPRAGEYHLAFEILGYATGHLRVTVGEGDSLFRIVQLADSPIDVDAVEIVDDAVDPRSVPRSLTVIDEDRLMRTQGQTIAEALAELPGVSMLQTGPSIAKPVIRGQSGQRIRIMDAGVPLEGQQWGDEHAPAIDPFSAGRIEVLRGAATVEYGAGALGGVIAVQPREPHLAPRLKGGLLLNGFSNNRQGAGAIHLERGVERVPGLAWYVQGSYRLSGDAATPDYLLNNTGFEERNGAASLTWRRSKLESSLLYRVFTTELGIYQGAHIGNLTDLERAIARGGPVSTDPFSYDIAAPRQTIRHDLLSWQTRFKLAPGTVAMTYGWQQNRRQEFDSHRGFSSTPPKGPAFDLELTTYTVDLSFRHRPLGRWYGKMGITGLRQGNARLTSGYLIPNYRLYTGGVYWIENWSAGGLTVNGGLRLDLHDLTTYSLAAGQVLRESHDYTNLSGVIGANWRATSALRLGTTVGTAWRPPGINELYSEGVHHGTARFESGNPALEPESSLNIDGVVSWTGDRFAADLNLYHNRYDNYIYLFPEPEPVLTIRGAFPAFTFEQGAARLWGLETSAAVSLLPSYELKMSGSLLRSWNRDRGEPLIWMPADRTTITHHFHEFLDGGAIDNGYLDISLELVAEQTRYPEGADYAPPPPGYGLLHVEAGAQVTIGGTPVTVTLGVRNLLDKTYRDYLSRFRYYAANPGRNMIVRMRIPIGS